MSICTIADNGWVRLLLDAWQVNSVCKSERPNLPNDTRRLAASADANVLFAKILSFFIHITSGAGFATSKMKKKTTTPNYKNAYNVYRYSIVQLGLMLNSQLSCRLSHPLPNAIKFFTSSLFFLALRHKTMN